MSQTFQVVETFRDLQDNDRIYEPGEIYEGAQTKERLAELTTKKNKIRKVLIQEVVEEKEGAPKHVGGGTYELSNGEKVKGKEEAIKAEEALIKAGE